MDRAEQAHLERRRVQGQDGGERERDDRYLGPAERDCLP
jgi:hypothetical protein